MPARIEWNGTDRAMKQRMSDYEKRVQAGMYTLGQNWGAILEAYAKNNAKWTDRTGNARQGLTGRAALIQNGDAVMIVLFQTMDYGLYLETANQMRYAIVMPTLEIHYTKVWDSYKRMLGAR